VLMQAQHKASEALYKNQADAQAGGAGGAGQAGGASEPPPSGNAKPEGDVIDAEVVEDEKK
jgi:hypothetical protein